jgi:hypothetical protein
MTLSVVLITREAGAGMLPLLRGAAEEPSRRRWRLK